MLASDSNKLGIHILDLVNQLQRHMYSIDYKALSQELKLWIMQVLDNGACRLCFRRRQKEW